MILLIIVVWLFVLAPLLLRGQRPIRKTGEAFDDTRVLYEGGSGEVPARRQPRMGPDDVRKNHESGDDDYEVVAAEDDDDDLLIDERPEPKGPSEEVVDGEVVNELPTPAPAVAAAEDSGSTAASVLYPEMGQAQYDVDDSYISPGDLLQDTAEQEVVEEEVVAEVEAPVEDTELTEDEVEFAQHRSGRGGWDPERDKRNSASLFQRRRRTLMGLGVAVLLTVIAGIVLGSWAWWIVAVSVALTVVYLVALRQQVREERRLRARRVRHLRRARLGVRHADDSNFDVPKNLRRPGAVVVEMDDESPDFDYLRAVNENERREEPAPSGESPDNGFSERVS